MPIAGGTSPITVAGTVTMNVAEFLGTNAVIQLAAPGTPVLMGAGASLLDMKAGTFSFGALETALMVAACAEVAHELGVPVLCPGLGTDAKYGGIQAGYEKALKGLATAAAGADLVTGGIGLLSGAGLMSLPQIVIDAEIAEMIARLTAGADISASSVMAEAIERVGFSGSYLSERSPRAGCAPARSSSRRSPHASASTAGGRAAAPRSTTRPTACARSSPRRTRAVRSWRRTKRRRWPRSSPAAL